MIGVEVREYKRDSILQEKPGSPLRFNHFTALDFSFLPGKI